MRVDAATFHDPKPRGNYPRNGSLSDSVIVKMRLEYARGYKSAYQLAAEHGISQSTVNQIVQGSTYKSAGGLITWPNGKYARPIPAGKVRGHCWDVACSKPIAASGHAQRMHMCEDCFRINGGRKSGRDRKGRTKTFACKRCGKRFVYYVAPNGYRPRFCSRKCQAQDSGEQRSKRPDALTRDVLYELYWGKNLTAAEISARYDKRFTTSSVTHWLVADDIPRRSPNWRRYPTCAVEGCGGSIHKLFNGIRWYGRLCKPHLRERDANRNRFYQAEIQEAQGGELMREIAKLTSGLPEAVKMDAEQEIMVAALSGDIPLPLSRESVKPLIAKVFRENADAWKFVSLAAPTREGDDAQTWGERLGIS